MKIDWKRKLTSRKWWVSVAALVSGLILAFGGGDEVATTVSGCIMATAAVVGYTIGEGLADGANKGGGDNGDEQGVSGAFQVGGAVLADQVEDTLPEGHAAHGGPHKLGNGVLDGCPHRGSAPFRKNGMTAGGGKNAVSRGERVRYAYSLRGCTEMASFIMLV